MKTTHIETHNVQVLRGAGTHFSFFFILISRYSLTVSDRQRDIA